MSRIALLIGTDEMGRPALALSDARRHAIRCAPDWALPTSPFGASVVSAFPRPVENARHFLKQAREARMSHLLLFGAQVREAFELALLMRLQPDMPRVAPGGVSIVAIGLRSAPGGGQCHRIDRGRPLCLAYVIEDSLQLAA